MPRADLFTIPPGHHLNRAGLIVPTVRTNVFRMTPDRSLDRVYLRTCAIYRLLKSQRITFDQAFTIAPKLRPIIELWRKTLDHRNEQR